MQNGKLKREGVFGLGSEVEAVVGVGEVAVKGGEEEGQERGE